MKIKTYLIAYELKKINSPNKPQNEPNKPQNEPNKQEQMLLLRNNNLELID